MDGTSEANGFRRRPQVSRQFVELHRRRRFAVAAAEVAHEFGVGGITVSILVGLAGTARNTFYELFTNQADCLRFAVADAYERLFAPVRETSGEGDWLPEVEAAIAGFFERVAAEPLSAELFLIHSFGVELGPDDVGFETGAAALERLLGGGRAAGAQLGRPPAPALAEEYLARVVLAVAARALRREEVAALAELAPEVALLVGTVDLGAEGAAEALDAAVVVAR